MPRTLPTAFLSFSLCLLTAPVLAAADAPKPVNFDHDVRPIFAAKCYACHGPDGNKRRAELRLDIKTDALKKIVKPGDAAGSELVKRIHGDDPDHVMPPRNAKTGPLSPEQIDTLRRWVDQGAKFERHWAYVPPVRPVVPNVKNQTWVRNPIDAFVAAAQERQGYQPAPEADRVTLLRRLSFDLTGLPPTPEEVDAFVKDAGRRRLREGWSIACSPRRTTANAWRCTGSIWCAMPTPPATTATTTATCALYRDYVIDAFNANKPFDRFTIEQLAGDLLPNADRPSRRSPRATTACCRRPRKAAPRRRSTRPSTPPTACATPRSVWLASTMGCAECHNHKFDPFTTKDFYSFEAFFADVKEAAVGRQEQTPFPSKEQTEALASWMSRSQRPKRRSTSRRRSWTRPWRMGEDGARRAAQGGAGRRDGGAGRRCRTNARRSRSRPLSAYFRTVAPQLSAARAAVAKLEEAKEAADR